MADPLRVLLAGGGTAGHVNPMLATAAALREEGAEVAALGTAEGLEADLVPAAGIILHHVPRVPLPRRPSLDFLRLPGRLRQAVRAAGQAMDDLGADVVVGYGGYVAVPAYRAAKRRGIPVVVHEQNARPGIANRLGARHAAVVALTFASTPLEARRGRTDTTGLPLRGPVAVLAADRSTPEGARQRREEAAAALGLDAQRPTLLITGGSLGAQRINEAAAGAAVELLASGAQVLHLTGRGKDEAVRERLAQAGVAAERYQVRDYLGAMEQAYALADLVLCRSGAGTVAELAALGLPAIYVPLPIGNGEQRLNAGDVVAAGGGRIVEDSQLDTAYVAGEIAALLAQPSALRTMGEAAARSGVTDGAQRLVELIEGARSSRRFSA